jgi:hypothetical protein
VGWATALRLDSMVSSASSKSNRDPKGSALLATDNDRPPQFLQEACDSVAPNASIGVRGAIRFTRLVDAQGQQCQLHRLRRPTRACSVVHDCTVQKGTE